jgi:hypothetical protein
MKIKNKLLKSLSLGFFSIPFLSKSDSFDYGVYVNPGISIFGGIYLYSESKNSLSEFAIKSLNLGLKSHMTFCIDAGLLISYKIGDDRSEFFDIEFKVGYSKYSKIMEFSMNNIKDLYSNHAIIFGPLFKFMFGTFDEINPYIGIGLDSKIVIVRNFARKDQSSTDYRMLEGNELKEFKESFKSFNIAPKFAFGLYFYDFISCDISARYWILNQIKKDSMLQRSGNTDIKSGFKDGLDICLSINWNIAAHFR